MARDAETRLHSRLKRDTPLSLEDARRIVGQFVAHYNDVRLHSAIGYIAPKDKLEGRAEAMLAERERKLAVARETRKVRRQEKRLTEKKEGHRLHVAGETEAGNAGDPAFGGTGITGRVVTNTVQGEPGVPPPI